MVVNHVLLLRADATELPQFIHSEDPIDPAQLLTESGGHPPYLTIDLEVDNEKRGKVMLGVHDGQVLNQRAMQVLVYLTEVHMVLTGPVLFLDLDEDTMFGVLRDLSDQ